MSEKFFCFICLIRKFIGSLEFCDFDIIDVEKIRNPCVFNRLLDPFIESKIYSSSGISMKNISSELVFIFNSSFFVKIFPFNSRIFEKCKLVSSKRSSV